MRHNLIFIASTVAASLLLFGCNLPIDNSDDSLNSEEFTSILTAAAETLAAQGGPNLPSAVPAATDIPTGPTVTALPSATAFPTATPTATIPCDRAAFVKDVTIPDGADFTGGDSFTKTWRLRNNGSCTWTTAYALVFDSGNSMSGSSAVQLTSSVEPNQTVDVSVELTAPNTADTYRGNWKLRNANGVVFGLGNSGSPFYVEIDVVSSVNFSLSFDNVHMCFGSVYATVKITNTGVEFLQSARVQVEDVDDGVILAGPVSGNKPFVTTSNGCPPGNSDADPGETYYIAVDIGVSPPSGHLTRFTVRLCTEDSLSGTCYERWVEFELP